MNFKPNKENDKCAYCKVNRGTENMFDEEHNQYWLCDICINKMGWK